MQSGFHGSTWDLFVDVYGPLIHRFCRRRGVQDADTRDVTQNVFLSIRQSIQGFVYTRERGRFRNWLGTVTMRELIRHQRKSEKAGRANLLATEGASLQAEDDAWSSECNQHLCETALRRIRPDFEDDTWRAFELLWKQDLKTAEVTQIMNKRPDWLYQAKYRVLKRLEQELRYLSADIASFTKDSS